MADMRGWAPSRSASSAARHRTSRTVSPLTLTPASPAPPASSPRPRGSWLQVAAAGAHLREELGVYLLSGS